MSQVALQTAAVPSSSSLQDSATTGRAQAAPVSLSLAGHSQQAGITSNNPLTVATRSQRKPAPSPLHTSTAISPPSSASPGRPTFPTPLRETFSVDTLPRIITTAAPDEPRSPREKVDDLLVTEKTYYNSDSSGAATPEERSPGPPLSARLPHESRSASDPVVSQKPRGGLPPRSPTMAGPSGTTRTEAVKGAPRNSSMDSQISAMSSRSQSNKNGPQSPTEPVDVANLIKTAGSAEAVIQYLLKEKHSQSQQNAQLWRLVDKQRAMILGLNKDLERALKDKEKYRKKLKEVIAVQEPPPGASAMAAPGGEMPRSLPKIDVTGSTEQVLNIPISPGLDSDSQKHSPIDMSLAPYPITPPADQPNAPPSAVGEMLDPAHAMPKPAEHAYDQFDHEAQERQAEAVRKEADARKDIPFNLALPPSRSFASEPPRGPPPQLPPTAPPPPIPVFDSPPMSDQSLGQFPAPPAPPPRKPPPAPLQLRNMQQNVAVAPEEEIESDSDYDDILEVDEIPIRDIDKRGRRRTREEDDQERELLARKEAEMRSLSKKSKSTNSQKGTPREAEPEAMHFEGPVSPRLQQGLQRPNISPPLAGAGNLGFDFRTPPLLSPGLPASPRPVAATLTSPPLSPRIAGFPPAPLSPRPPRQAIPLPPNTPLMTPAPSAEPLNLTSPKPLNIVKKVVEVISPPSPSKSSRESPTERTRIFKGFMTEEYPDILIPPNALPSIDIRVASSRMKPSRASLLSLTQLEEDPVFTLAVLSRMDGGELWRVEKDSASLAKLDQRLKQCPAFTARTPDRSLFSGHAPAKLDARRLALDQYLDELLNTPLDTATALELCRYLSTNTLPPNADETGSSGDSIVELANKVGPGGRPFRTGYLTKRGKNFGGWKARFFVLDGPYLKYFETPGGAHLGTIKLQNAQIGKQSHQNDNSSPARTSTSTEDIDNQYRHAFLILEPKKKDPSSLTKHVLCAESDKERDQWVEALLRWIDYKDTDEEDAAKKDQVHDRQGSGGSERINGMNAKKKMYGQGRQQQQQQQFSDSQDTLIGVSYEATKQGDIPQGAPTRSRGMGGHDHEPPQTMTSQSAYSISAPRDPQVISDSAAWGSKLGSGLAPPPTDDKKARKRSFFGFGPKTRTSSDGQDSLFGTENGTITTGSPANEYRGPVRQVFGATLAEAVRYNAPTDVNVPLPAVVYRCIQYLDAKNAILEEGIFRLSGSNVVIKQLRERFNTEGDVNLLADQQYHDIHAVASLLKLYLRELPTTILTRDLHLDFLEVTEIHDQREKIRALHDLTQKLPQANSTLLKYLISFLIKIINHADMNKMTVRNVGIVFSPTLNIPAPVFAMFLQNYEGIFGIEPEEYELPSPVSERERGPSVQGRRPSADTHPRPSTSSTSASPHRQRLMEAVMEGQGQRNASTPPPVLMSMSQLNQTRSTPTPPPQRQLSYEPSYLAQQGSQQSGGGNVFLQRPAYESGFVVPPGYDPAQHMAAQRTPAGYDRAMYDTGAQQLAPYDQSFGMKARNRESAVFMGALNHQGSKSRLREETRY